MNTVNEKRNKQHRAIGKAQWVGFNNNERRRDFFKKILTCYCNFWWKKKFCSTRRLSPGIFGI